MGIQSRIYPPIMEYNTPATTTQGTCRIYFAQSQFTDSTNLSNYVFVKVSNTLNNFNALAADVGVACYPYNIDTSIDIDNRYKYYFDLPCEDLINQEFSVNQSYKVEISVCSNTVPVQNFLSLTIGQDNEKALFLSNYSNEMSDWSLPTVIKGIAQPYIKFYSLPIPISSITVDENLYRFSNFNNFSARLVYQNQDDKRTDSYEFNDFLESYQIYIYERESNILLSDSGKIYNEEQSDLNLINYNIPINFEGGEQYKIKIEYTTSSSYKSSFTFYFELKEIPITIGDASIDVFPSDEMGCNVVCCTLAAEDFNNYISIQRSSNRSSFKEWEELVTLRCSNTNGTNKIIWEDITVESGIFYKYRFAKMNKNKVYSRFIYTSDYYVNNYDATFLSENGRTLNIQFDNKLSNYQQQYSQAQVETLGSKYMFIQNNGEKHYSSFSISGIISLQSNILQKDLISKDYLLKEDTYDTDSTNNAIVDLIDESSIVDIYKLLPVTGADEQTIAALEDFYKQKDAVVDYIQEREFRNIVYDFLYDKKPKLFRNLTLGNFIVNLENISFNPIDTLFGLVYEFSADASQIADTTAENYLKYNIYPYNNPDIIETIIEDNYDDTYTFQDTSGRTGWSLSNLVKEYIENHYVNQGYSLDDYNIQINLNYLFVNYTYGEYHTNRTTLTYYEGSNPISIPNTGINGSYFAGRKDDREQSIDELTDLNKPYAQYDIKFQSVVKITTKDTEDEEIYAKEIAYKAINKFFYPGDEVIEIFNKTKTVYNYKQLDKVTEINSIILCTNEKINEDVTLYFACTYDDGTSEVVTSSPVIEMDYSPFPYGMPHFQYDYRDNNGKSITQLVYLGSATNNVIDGSDYNIYNNMPTLTKKITEAQDIKADDTAVVSGNNITFSGATITGTNITISNLSASDYDLIKRFTQTREAYKRVDDYSETPLRIHGNALCVIESE